MRVTIICSDPGHPVCEYLARWQACLPVGRHAVEIVDSVAQAPGGDLLLLVSCSEIVTAAARSRYRKCLVLHASDLPRGRGWSPHVWTILEGGAEVVVTLLEAEDKVDTGAIWHQDVVSIPAHALWDEINHLLFEAEVRLVDFALAHFDSAEPRMQDPSVEPSYHPRRRPADSRIDPAKPISEQFDLIRVCDPHRFPAHFTLRGHTYKLTLEKMDE